MLQSGPKDGVSVDIGEASGRHTMSALDRICMAWSSDVVFGGCEFQGGFSWLAFCSAIYRACGIYTDLVLPYHSSSAGPRA
jgi:hypothetical protein